MGDGEFDKAALAALLDLKGSSGWADEERAAAERLVAKDAEARRIVAAAHAVERAILAERPDDAAPGAVIGAVLAARRERDDPVVPGWLAGLSAPLRLAGAGAALTLTALVFEAGRRAGVPGGEDALVDLMLEAGPLMGAF